MAAVGGSVYRHVLGPALHAPLQDGFQHGICRIVPVEGEVVDKYDKLLPPPIQPADQGGQAAQIPLVRLNEPQLLHSRQGQQVLHRGRLARAALSVKQHIVHRLPLHEQPGIALHLGTLLLISQKLIRARAVRAFHRDERPTLPHKGPVPGKLPGALPSIGGGELVKGEGHPTLPPGQGCKHPLIIAVQQLAQVGQPPVAVHAGQQLKGGDIQPRRLFQRRVPAPPLGQHGVGPLRPSQGLVQPLAQARLPLHTQLVKQVGICLQPTQAVSMGGPRQQAKGTFHHRLGQNILIGRYSPQGGQHSLHIHGIHLDGDIIKYPRPNGNPSFSRENLTLDFLFFPCCGKLFRI